MSTSGGKKRRATRGVVASDISGNARLKRQYKRIKGLFKRHGILSPPPVNHVPGELPATDTAAGGDGAPAAAPTDEARPAAAGTSPGEPAETSRSHSAAREGTREEEDQVAHLNAGDPSGESPENDDFDGGDGGGYEDFGGDAIGGATSGGGDGDGGEAGSVLMGEETCMALFSGNGVELLVDQSSSNGKGEATTGAASRAGQGEGLDADAAEPAGRAVSSAGGAATSASAAPGVVGGGATMAVGTPPPPEQSAPSVPGKPGVAAASSAPLSVPRQRAVEKVVSPRSPSRPRMPPPPPLDGVAVALPAVPPASPPRGDSSLMGEETCMALFSGNEVELLVDPSPPPPEAEKAAGGGAGAGVEELLDVGAPPEPAVPPASAARPSARGDAQEEVGPGLPATQGGGVRAELAPPAGSEATSGDGPKVSPQTGVALAAEAPPRGGRDPSEGQTTAEAHVAVAAPPSPPSAPDGPPQPGPRFSSPVFRVGTLPSRARLGRAPPPAAAAAPSAPTVEGQPAMGSRAGPSEIPAKWPPRPPSVGGRAAASSSPSSGGTGPGPRGPGLATPNDDEQPLVGPAAPASPESAVRASSPSRDAEAEPVRVGLFLFIHCQYVTPLEKGWVADLPQAL